MPEESERRALLISKAWVQASIVVFLLGFFVLGLLAYRTYSADPPIPDRVVDPAGKTVFTGEEIRSGQRVFLNNGLMEYGSIFGHGAYLGPDYTADYLHRAALSVESRYGGAGSDRARERTIADFQANRYDPEADTLEYRPPGDRVLRARAPLPRLLLQPDDRAGTAPGRDRQPGSRPAS